ncbi:MAG TPA: cation:proton antiporter [Clostridia bacterium]|jgi:Kef-type K+ transport system membrane component KefB|nr:cation:proton antiporter [Clostridia bacterium]
MNVLLSLSLAMLAGLILTRVAKKFNLPNVTAYLVAGLLVGPFGLKWVAGNNLHDFAIITSLALGFIAFSIGGEFKLSYIEQIGSRAITITIYQALAAVLVVEISLWLLGVELPIILTLGAIAAATAPAATLMVVRQYKAEGPVTKTLLPVVALDDALGLIIFSLSIALAKTLASNATLTVESVVIQPLKEIIFSLLTGSVLGLLLALSMRFFRSRANRISLVITAVVAGVALSEKWALSSLLVCMMIGAILVNFRDDAEKILNLSDQWTPPIFMLFFVISGAELDLSVLPTVGLIGVVYILARSLGKYFGTYFGSTVVKANDNIKKYLGFTLLPQAGVAVGMAQMAMTQLPQYGKGIRAVVLSATLIYELVGPVITKIALTKAGEIKQQKVSG